MNKSILASVGATLLAWGVVAIAGDSHERGQSHDRGGDSQGRLQGHDHGRDRQDRWNDHRRGDDIRVMTQNQYLGGDIAPLILAVGTEDFNAAVVTVLQQIASSHTPTRVKALAGEILDEQPELVALQEVWEFECLPAGPQDPGYGCDDPSIRAAFGDHLELTRKALGKAYYVVARVTNLNLQSFGAYPGIPFEINGVPAFLKATDRDVILARRDVAPSAVPVDFGCSVERISDDGCNYEYVAELDLIGRIERGFVAVDVTVEGRHYRFMNTHLETRDPPLPGCLQAAQMAELLGRALGTPPSYRLILAGDFNSDPGEAPDLCPEPTPTPFMQALGVGLYDAWLLQPGGSAGFTCCQAADLRNWPSQLFLRIDLLFVREMPSRVQDLKVLGAMPSDRIGRGWHGLWPSDHAAVVATLRYH